MATFIGFIVGFIVLSFGIRLLLKSVHSNAEKAQILPVYLLSAICVIVGLLIIGDAMNTWQILSNANNNFIRF